ncbi:FecR family protein [Chitinophaga barathri]|uniref:DUF4974 domain-containing protein n=1 Tax=Chitinophaga barathri TaxID=1647451 RepID=A0A3N4MHQ2_9BACT|nr:FecR domain-containing protein [Chitinophaga barathri]RPD42955.1 DUF4974 domain-containing protein [Chitinophaga barathri]
MNEQTLLALIERVENGTATDEELGVYNAWCNSFQRTGEPVPDFETVRAEMLQRINAQIGHKPVRRLRYRIAAAAAVLLLLISGGIYLYMQPSGQLMADKSPSAVPVTDKAVLTLADGTTITLGEAAEGELATQSGAKITKHKDNQLSYESVSEGKDSDLAYNTLRMPRGEKYRVTLPDGSQVWLNASSSLRFPTSFTGGERVVELSGEAYFEIAAQPSRPFKVKTGQMEVQVLGTKFNIMAYPDEPEIKSTLVQGGVRLYAESGEVVLKPGQQGLFNGRQAGFRVKQVNAADVMAWKNGFFVFNDEDMAVIMRAIERWYDVDIVLTPGVANKKFGAVISQRKDIASVLKALELTGSIHFKIEGRKITVAQQ